MKQGGGIYPFLGILVIGVTQGYYLESAAEQSQPGSLSVLGLESVHCKSMIDLVFIDLVKLLFQTPLSPNPWPKRNRPG
jgi:hypothetical protein